MIEKIEKLKSEELERLKVNKWKEKMDGIRIVEKDDSLGKGIVVNVEEDLERRIDEKLWKNIGVEKWKVLKEMKEWYKRKKWKGRK